MNQKNNLYVLYMPCALVYAHEALGFSTHEGTALVAIYSTSSFSKASSTVAVISTVSHWIHLSTPNIYSHKYIFKLIETKKIYNFQNKYCHVPIVIFISPGVVCILIHLPDCFRTDEVIRQLQETRNKKGSECLINMPHNQVSLNCIRNL